VAAVRSWNTELACVYPLWRPKLWDQHSKDREWNADVHESPDEDGKIIGF
jgi:hypothetical protein